MCCVCVCDCVYEDMQELDENVHILIIIGL